MKKLFISLLAIFLIACGNNSSSTTPTSSSAAEPEPNINDEPMQTETNNEPKNDEAQMGSIEEILK